MARSTPQRRLYCSVCKKKDLQKVLLREARTGEYDPTWFGVEVIGESSPGKAKCKCLNCQHEWTSDSMAAKRELRALVVSQIRQMDKDVAAIKNLRSKNANNQEIAVALGIPEDSPLLQV